MDEPPNDANPADKADQVDQVDPADSAQPGRRPRTPLADRPLTQPHPDRLSPDDPLYAEIIRAHTAALEAGADTYVDPRTGYTVLTAGYLARRGTCCDSGCRHCPYIA